MRKVNLDLRDVAGNSYAILNAFERRALKEGWTEEQVANVKAEAQQGNYDNLIQVIQSYCQ